MATKLDKSIKRELDLDGKLYTVTIAPDGIKVVEKGKRKGQEIPWRTIISGDASLNAVAGRTPGVTIRRGVAVT